jgi:hypothetical protein
MTRITAGQLQEVGGSRKACCRKYLKDYTGRLGMGACACGRQWYHFAPGWAKKWGTDRVYREGQFVGVASEYGAIRKMMKAARRADDKRATASLLIAGNCG